jgi:hypothetical protein
MIAKPTVILNSQTIHNCHEMKSFASLARSLFDCFLILFKNYNYAVIRKAQALPWFEICSLILEKPG